MTKYLHFSGATQSVGLQVTPSVGATVVTGVRFCTANDAVERDPVRYELSGSNVSIDGPYTLIASGDIKDFAGATAWTRQTWTTTPMKFANTVAYKHYQLMFPACRGPGQNSMQIAEIELLMDVYTATNPSPADKKTGVAQPLFTWVPGDTAVLEDVYLGTTPNLTLADRMVERQSAQFKLYYHYLFPLEPGKTYYWRIDDIDLAGNVYTGQVWSFTMAALIAYDPRPRDGEKWLDPGVDLSWQPGQRATKHELYFGTDQAKVAARDASVFKGSLTLLSFDPGPLAMNTTYYWVVDEIDNLGSKKEGDVWSFTTTGGGGGLKAEYFNNTDLSGFPVLTRIDSSINVTAAIGAPVPDDNYSVRWTADLEIDIADTYVFAINCHAFTRMWIDGDLIIDKWPVAGVGAPTVISKYFSLPVPLTKGVHSLQVEYISTNNDAETLTWSTATMAEVIVPAGPLQPPVRAGGANPPNGAVDVKQTPVLRWSAGMKAAKHNVYFGTDATAVLNATTASAGIHRGQQDLAANTYVPTETPLAWNSTYYWRIDEVNGVDVWKGDVWSFTTADFLVVDDFEDYTDDVGSRIFQTWKDGWGYNEPPPGYAGNGTGSGVGNAQPPFAGQTIVHTGAQSMPLAYDNSGTGGKARYSETFREWILPQDWTVNNLKALTLYFYGGSANAAEQLYVALEDSGGQVRAVNHPNTEAVQANIWQEWNIPLTDFAGVNLKAIKKMYIGLGNRTSPQAGGSGTIFIDDIGVYPSRCVPSKGKPAADLSGNCVVDYPDVEIMADLWLDSGFVITPVNPGTTNLVARYTFDGNTNDSAGSNNGTAIGLPTYGAGKFNQAIRLDGVDDFVDCGAGASLNITGAVTVSAWIKLSALGIDQKLASNEGGNATDGGYKLGVFTNNRVEFEIRNSTNAATLNRSVGGGTVLTPGVWYHVAGVYSEGNYIRTYVNGVLDREMATTAVLATSTGTFKVGGSFAGDGSLFNGLVDEVQVYKAALSGAQIAWLAGHTSPLSIPADLHQDDKIDLKDFAVLADSWLDQLFWP